MAQLLIEGANTGTETDESFIAETAKLAQLLREQRVEESSLREKNEEKNDQLIFANECRKGINYMLCINVITCILKDVVRPPGIEEVEAAAATNLGKMLSDVSVKYDEVLRREFDKRIAPGINYETFSTICSNVLHSTFNSVVNRWDQAVLVFAGYMRVSDSLQGNDISRQNEISTYIGRYLSDMGLKSWIQLQGGWVSIVQLVISLISLFYYFTGTCRQTSSKY